MDDAPKGIWGRYALFVLLAFLLFAGNVWLGVYLRDRNPPPREAAEKAEEEKPAAKKPAVKAGAKPASDVAAAGGDATTKPKVVKPEKEEPAPPKPPKPKIAPLPEPAEQWVTLGSADPASAYQMLVTLTNRGAAVSRVELNSPRYHDLDDRSGYLGHVVMDSAGQGGARVEVVGPGTPAAEAGLRPGDRITALDGREVRDAAALEGILKKTKPKQTITLAVSERDGKKLPQPLELSATLRRRPLEVIRPEGDDPQSFLLTLAQVDQDELPPLVHDAAVKVGPQRPEIDRELPGVRLRGATWKMETPKADPDDPAVHKEVTFSRELPELGLKVSKTFTLAQAADAAAKDNAGRAYHLTLAIRVENLGDAPRKVAYQLDGPTGLPTEGAWYATKVASSGIRDAVVSADNNRIAFFDAAKLAGENVSPVERPLQFIGVDAVYFAAILIPQPADAAEPTVGQWQPLRVSEVKEQPRLDDTSVRVISTVAELAAEGKPGDSLAHVYEIFAGPKKPALLAEYGLQEIVTYGWYPWVAKPMLMILHGFYKIIPNYGIAIIFLTVLVRGAMFPLSRKQALNAQKMQELQPEMKRIQEKYKDNLEARGKAQRELFQKHNYNPLGGCFVVLLQLPIFVGLYRALMVDVELRQAPLISESIRWCSNLAAPDMLFDWSRLWEGIGAAWVNSGDGMFALGPYFNILPLVTIFMFIWQQKKFMPPAADEQARTQMKIMQYMMIFMGVLFYKVAAGLCIYFIATSLWSIAERQWLPKRAAAAEAAGKTPKTPQNRESSAFRKARRKK